MSPEKLSKGKWYAEYESISGSLAYVIGFSCTYCGIAITQNYMSNTLFAYVTDNQGNGAINFNGTELNQKPQRFNLNLGYSDRDRVGIAIDLDNKYVSYLCNDQINTFKYETECKEWRFVVREINSSQAEDTVSVFMREFKYEPVFGSMPWAVILRSTCQKHPLAIIRFSVLFFFCLFDKNNKSSI